MKNRLHFLLAEGGSALPRQGMTDMKQKLDTKTLKTVAGGGGYGGGCNPCPPCGGGGHKKSGKC